MNARLVPLGLILALAFGVRLWGITFGLPDVIARPDEGAVVGLAVELLRGHFWAPFFDYPRLLPYTYAAAFACYGWIGQVLGWFGSFQQFLGTYPEHWQPLFLIGRLVSVTAGTATVFVIYRLASETLDRVGGLIAAFFLSLAFLHVRDSHYATTDVLLAYLCWTALLWLVRAARTGERRALYAGTIVAALALSTKYSAAPICLSVAAVLVLWRVDRRITTRRFFLEAALAGTLGAAIFLTLNPYVIFDYARFRQAMSGLAESYSMGMASAEHLGSGWRYHLTQSLRHGLGLPLLLAAVPGAVMLARSNVRLLAIMLAFLVPYYWLAGESRLLFVRYVIPVVPFVCYAASIAVAEIARRVTPQSRARHLAAAIAAVALVAPSAASVIRFNQRLASRDSRSIAAAWILSNVPKGASIAQSGSEYGRVGLGPHNEYRHWEYREAWGTYVDMTRRRSSVMSGLPDYIVVHESPLPYSYVVPQMQADVNAHYEQVRVVRGQPARASGNAYDVQDAFFLPYAGFRDVPRPGPTIYIWKRK